MIYVYQNRNGFRVVSGDNPKRAAEHTNIEPRVYRTAADAYRVETDESIRNAILRIAPDADKESTPATRHHVVTAADSEIALAIHGNIHAFVSDADRVAYAAKRRGAL